MGVDEGNLLVMVKNGTYLLLVAVVMVYKLS